MRQAEVTAAKRMIERTRSGSDSSRSGSLPTPAMARPRCWPGWSRSKAIEPHVPVFDKSRRNDGTFAARTSPTIPARCSIVCPGGKPHRGPAARSVNDGATLLVSREQARLRGLRPEAPLLPERAGSQGPALDPRRRPRHGARHRHDRCMLVSRRERKKVEMLFAHLKRILKLDRLRLRGPNGARDEFLLAATAQNLRKLAKLIPQAAPARPVRAASPRSSTPAQRLFAISRLLQHNRSLADTIVRDQYRLRRLSHSERHSDDLASRLHLCRRADEANH